MDYDVVHNDDVNINHVNGTFHNSCNINDDTDSVIDDMLMMIRLDIFFFE